MAKKSKKKVSKVLTANKMFMTNEQYHDMKTAVVNTTYTMHREVLNRLLNPQDNIDTACGYPITLSIKEYRDLYDRFGLAKRVVHIWPDECWQTPPEVYENEDSKYTTFENAWVALETKFSLYSILHRVDALSGIGSHGGLLLGIDDGLMLDKPAAGIDPNTGEIMDDKKVERNLIYVQVYDESKLKVEEYEKNVKSPRFGYPKTYSMEYSEGGTTGANKIQRKVHWTRVLHVADNRESSEVMGVSRLQAVYNYLYDAKKVGGGSGEMFWKGGFPGYSFELSPEAAELGADMDTESIKEQMLLWSNGLQRWLALKGVQAKSLNPQLADPTGPLDVQLRLIAISIGVPYRVLLGSEEGKLASTQDKRTWNSRVARRQTNYCAPMIVRPFIDRLIALGCLPNPKKYVVSWSDLNVATEDDISKVALNRTDAFSKYVAGGVDALIPPRQYFTEVHKLSDETTNAILKAQEKYETIFDEPEDESVPKSTKPAQTSPS